VYKSACPCAGRGAGGEVKHDLGEHGPTRQIRGARASALQNSRRAHHLRASREGAA
jgi:hypothetical protein